MTPEFPQTPREELEARITAMILAELSDAEAAALREQIAADPELAALERRLRHTAVFLEQAAAEPEGEKLAPPEPLRLASEKRDTLLKAFKGEKKKEEPIIIRAPIEWRTYVALAAMILILFIITSAMFLPSLAKAKSKSRAVAQRAPNRDYFKWSEPDSSSVVRVQQAPASETESLPGAALSRATDEINRGTARGRTLATIRDKRPGEGVLADVAPTAPPAETPALLGTQPADQSKNWYRIELPKSAATAESEFTTGGRDGWAMAGVPVNRPVLGDAPVLGRAFGGGAGGGGFGGHADRSGLGVVNGQAPVDLFSDTDAAKKSEARLGYFFDSDDGRAAEDRRKSVLESRSEQPPIAEQPASQVAANSPAPAFGEDFGRGFSAGIGGARYGGVPGLAPNSSAPSGPAAAGRVLADSEARTTPARPAGKEAKDTLAEMNAGMGMGGAMSMNYYMSNPELMKRYFPQMYSQMQAQNGRGDGVQAAVDPATGLPADRFATSDFSIDPLTGLPAVRVEKPESEVELGQRFDSLSTTAESLGKQLSLQKSDLGRVAEGDVVARGAVVNEGKQTAAEDSLGFKVKAGDAVEKARELDQLKSVKESIEQVMAEQKTQEAIPKTGMVRLLDEAVADVDEPGTMEKLRRALGGQVERKTQVEVTKDQAITSASAAGYDPYFLQTEAERIRSNKVLDKTIEELNLEKSWASQLGRPVQRDEARKMLRGMIEVTQPRNTSLAEISVKSKDPTEAAKIANSVAGAYARQNPIQSMERASTSLESQRNAVNAQIAKVEEELRQSKGAQREPVAAMPVSTAATPQPEIAVAANPFSTFSLNVSDVSFKLAQASLEKGQLPDPATIRGEEFINAFDYRDPDPNSGAPVAFAWERARYPFAHDRDMLRFSVKTAAIGRAAGRPMNLVLLLDSSGSMERADRVQIINQCLRVLGSQLQPQDRVSVVAFARTARLWVDGLEGSKANELPQRVGNLNPEGGTNLEEAMDVAYQTAFRHFIAGGVNRVVLLTDGAANLGDVQPASLKKKVEARRQQGIALDCFGIGWEGLNDDLLEQLSRNGDGRYGFVNTPEAASTEFAGQLAGALKVAASDVKVQVEFNPKRATAYRQIGYAKHQLTKEQFRDNKVDAAELGAAEAGNALYVVQVNPAGEGPIATVRARFKVPGTNDYREHEWPVPYEGAAKTLDRSSAAMRLATVASAFSESLVSSPYAGEVTSDRLLNFLSGVPKAFDPDPRPHTLENMIRQAKSLAGK